MLGLDDEDAARVGRRTLQWARALAEPDEESGREPDALQAAALYRLAAGYLLLDPEAGRSACAEAAGHLREIGDSYANPLAVCATGYAVLDTAVVEESLTPAARAHLLTMLAWDALADDEQDGLERYWGWRRAAEPDAPLPASHLRIPLSATVAVLDAAIGESPDRLAPAVSALLSRVDEVYGAAMRDRYHWRLMLSRVMPVEPEIVAPLAVAALAGRRAGAPLEEHLAGAGGAPARVALSIATSIAASAS
jgi:hypothetical protein